VVLLAKNIDLYLLLYFSFPLLILNYSLNFSPERECVTKYFDPIIFLNYGWNRALTVLDSR
jgi:hypothetical protein